MGDDPIEAELLDLSRRAGPKQPDAFQRATTLRDLLRQADRADSADELVRCIDRALLQIEEPDLQEVGRASFRRSPYTDHLLEDRLDRCAIILADRLQEARSRDWREGSQVAAPSTKTMTRRRKRMVVELAPRLRATICATTASPQLGTLEPRPIPGDRSEFLGDLTIPDGSLAERGQVLEKRWELLNAGNVPWHGRFLTRLGVAEGDTTPQTPTRIPIPDTEPGESIVISVTFRAPRIPGTYEVHWKMTDQHGRQYFPDRYRQGLWFTIVVSAPN